MMLLRPSIFLLALTMIPAARASAEDCSDKRGPDAIDCSVANAAAIDKKLNEAYKSLLAKLKTDPAKATKLIRQERAWIKKRDSDCQEQIDSYDLNQSDYSYKVAVSDCGNDAEIARTKELETLLKK